MGRENILFGILAAVLVLSGIASAAAIVRPG